MNYGLSFEDEPANGDDAVIAPLEDHASSENVKDGDEAASGETVVQLDAFRRK